MWLGAVKSGLGEAIAGFTDEGQAGGFALANFDHEPNAAQKIPGGDDAVGEPELEGQGASVFGPNAQRYIGNQPAQRQNHHSSA